LGQAGENQAASFLISLDYVIKDRNVLFSSGEIDIIAFDPHQRELVFFEVKTRTNSGYGDPTMAVNWRKKRAWKRAAAEYLRFHPTNADIRFDIITVGQSGLHHYQNITL
jgi:putative endonuclease